MYIKCTLYFTREKAEKDKLKGNSNKNPIPPTRRPMRQSTHHQHSTDMSANTLPTCRPTHYRQSTDVLADVLADALVGSDS